MELSISIIAIESRRGGSERLVTLTVSSGEHSETVKFAVGAKMLREVGEFDEDRLPCVITREQFDSLEYDAKLWAAVKKGLDILSYSDNTRSAMIKKLRERSFDKYIAEDAADYLVANGCIDEAGMLERLVDKLASVKLYGKGRIKTELYKKGIAKSLIDERLPGLLDEIDFEANLRQLIGKKCDIPSLSDRDYREKVYAAMYRLGYGVSDTRDAIKYIMEENEE